MLMNSMHSLFQGFDWTRKIPFFMSGSRHRCHSSFVQVYAAEKVQNESRSYLEKIPEIRGKSDEIFRGDKRSIRFCGKLEQFHKTEVEMTFEGQSDHHGYLVEYSRHLRNRMRRLRYGFQLSFR